MIDASPSNISLTAGGRKFNLRSARDRRALNKELRALSKAELKIDITRLSNRSLKKTLSNGTFEGRALTAEQKNMFETALRLKGISEGSLSALTAVQYLNGIGVKLYNGGLSQNTLDILEKIGYTNIDISSLSEGNIVDILSRLSDKNIKVPDDLSDFFERARRLQSVNLDKKEGINALLNEISLAGKNIGEAGLVRGSVNISELSTKQIKMLLKNLPQNSEMANLLNQTLKLRELLDKKSKLLGAISKMRKMGGAMMRNAMFKLRGHALGDGMYAFYSAYRTTRTVVEIFQALRVIRTSNKAAFRHFLEKGKVGGLRYKIRNSGHFRRKYARMDRREAKMFKKAQKKAHKRQAKINKRKVRINKVKGRLSKRVPKRFKKMPKGLQKFGRGFKKLGKGLSKSLNVVLKPFKFVTGVVNKAKQAIMEKLIIPLIKYTLIFVGAIVIIQIAMGLFSAAADGLYSIIQPLTNDTDTEIAGEDENYSATNELGITRTENYTIEESLTYNSVELCINLDSAFKYYIEKYYEESKVINAVKDSIKEENEDELKSFYDPAANKYLNLKRLGTTLNKIQTGIYYSYYNGDAEEIGFKSNSKDIASMANAWIGADYHAKGLYKSYVEKLWNYSHMVAYAPRKVSDTYSYSTYRTGDDTESYGDNKYVYECASGKESSECYENEYSYYCNEASSKVYTDKKIRTDIKNGADKTTPTDKTGTPSGLVTQTLKDTSEVEYLTKSYNVTNGIAEYNANGCTNDILTYHDGSGTNVTAEVVNTTKGGYNTTKNLPSEEKSNGRLENVTISFWSSSTKPAGCNNWHEISYAVKVSGTIVEKKAYYCTGCAVKHNILNDEGKTKAFTSSHVANDEIIHIVPQKKAVHTGTKAQTIGGNTWYAKGSLSGCSEKLYYTHTLGTSHSGCNNYETVKSSVSTTTKCSGVCYKNPQYGKSYYYVTKVSSNKTKYEKVRTSNGLEYKLLYRADALKITGTVSAPPTGYSMKTPYKSKTQSVSLSQVSNLGTLTYTATNVSAYIYYSSINLSDGYTYIYDIKINGKVIMDTNLDSKITNTDKTDITYYPNTCNGTPADKHTTSTSVTTYKCKGHERCAGYLKDNPQDININYGSSYCCEHTLMHYCTGHVDLNIAVVTLFLNDTNSLAFLGVPKEVTTSEVNISNLMDLFTGETYEHLYDVQTDKEGTTYLYNNAFSNSKFERFDYEKFPLPSLSTWTEFSLDLKGKAVKDPGNFGNPLDTLRWMPDFVKDDVAQAADNTKSLNSVVSAWFSTFNKDIWEDRNDGFNSVAKVTAHHTQSDNSKFGKHHYFDGWFTYNKDGKLEMVEDDMPRDNGAYGRAVESLKEDWYDAYKIAFPGAYNSRPSNEEVERIEKTLTAVGTNANKMKVAKSLLKSIGDTYTNSGIKFAVDQYQEFYKAINGCENNQIKVAYTTSQAFSSSYTYQAKVFRRTLGVKSLEENKNVDNTITGLTAGDLIGAGDEVYVVIYTDVNATGVGIAKGHVIVATVNGAANLDSTDQIHLFSFTTEYIKKKSQLFWVYKCQ